MTSLGTMGFWLFLALVLSAPWIAGWLKERERQITLRKAMSDDGTIDSEVMKHFLRIQQEEHALRREILERRGSVEAIIFWIIITVAFLCGAIVLGLGLALAELGEATTNYTLLAITVVITFTIWIGGIFTAYRLRKPGGKNGPPTIT